MTGDPESQSSRPPIGRLIGLIIIVALAAALATGSCSSYASDENGTQPLIAAGIAAAIALTAGVTFLQFRRDRLGGSLYAIIAVSAYAAAVAGAWWPLVFPVAIAATFAITGGIVARSVYRRSDQGQNAPAWRFTTIEVSQRPGASPNLAPTPPSIVSKLGAERQPPSSATSSTLTGILTSSPTNLHNWRHNHAARPTSEEIRVKEVWTEENVPQSASWRPPLQPWRCSLF